MGQNYNINNNDEGITPKNTLQFFKDKLYLCENNICSMTKNSRDKLKYSEKLILDKVLNLAIKNEEYVLLNEMIKLVPVLKNYMYEKGFMDDNNYYVLPMGVDVEVLPS
ncbi:hypothetical protein [Rickettsia bellii]|uniref:Uncharacterized protein n=1 Tax=Rickettsia bellii str. RML Mogi TaxID=1359194 RepID=A0A0F3QFV0_RICBE|nr:hypothetical protein [Rickettsia bellii]KJV91423.1 hypothetical protein RBEMOGI_0024 [Rickettsia bellii str. RML Mogi]